jgi:transposase
MDVKTVGLDIGKAVFHLVGLDRHGKIVRRQRLTRAQLLLTTANLPPCLIGMEACPGSHFLGRRLAEQGHDVRLLPAQYVRPYVKTNKNDFLDAEAFAEAVSRPTMRFVPLKTPAQLELQAIHRARFRLVARRTALINQIRSFLFEQGVVTRTGRRSLEHSFPGLLADDAVLLPARLRWLLGTLWTEWRQLEAQIAEVTTTIERIADEDEACQRLLAVPGVGPLTATAMVSAIGDGRAFVRGRQFAAWLGLVPRQHSTGGKSRLFGISKRGNPYLRTLFVLGAQSVARTTQRDRHRFGPWLTELEKRTRKNVAVVALANKLARVAWAVLTRGEPYTDSDRRAA